MRKLLHLVIAFIMHALCSNFSFAQNLVLNPSFEDKTQCPDSWSRIYYATGWFQPNNFNGTVTNSSSTDYYHECSTFSPTEVPVAGFGFQYAHTGSAYAGIYSYDIGFNSREYIEGQLFQPLDAGKRYYVSFYVSLADEFKYGINRMGLHFSADSVLYNDPTYSYLPLSPHVKNPENNIITDTVNWVLISGYYYASGQEKFVTIGNFFSNANTDTTFIQDSVQENAYYYIDDVSVVLSDTDTAVQPPPVEINEFNLYPNPSLGEITFEWKLKKEMSLNLLLTDIVGRKIEKYYFSTSTIGKETLDLSNIANGVYILNVWGEGVNEHFKIEIVD